MWHARAREQGKFLAAQEGVHAIDGRNAGLDVIARVDTCSRVNWLAVDIAIAIGEWFRTTVNRGAQTVENASEHFFGNRHVQCTPEKAYTCAVNGQSRGTSKH